MGLFKSSSLTEKFIPHDNIKKFNIVVNDSFGSDTYKSNHSFA